MALSSKETIVGHLTEMYDAQYYDALHRDACYAFGERRRGATGEASPNEFPDYPKVFMTNIRAGRSKRLLNGAVQHLSKICSGSVEPLYSQVDPWTAEVRKAVWKRRTRGQFFGLEQINEATAGMFLDMDQMGVGFTHWLYLTNPRTKMLYTGYRTCSALRTLWDGHASHPGEARHWAPVMYWPAEVAKARWGAKVEDYIETYFADGAKNSGIKAVKTYWYENIGDEFGGDPTFAIVPKCFDADPLEKGDNPTGRLNMSYGVNVLLPGMHRPLGRIAMGSATNEILNAMEDRMLRTLKRPTIYVLSISGVNEKDWARVERGETDVVRSTDPEPNTSVVPVPGAEVAATFPQMREWYEKQLRSDLGTDEYDQGSAPSGVETLGEGQLIKGSTEISNAWIRLQYLASQLRGVHASAELMKIGDRDPLEIDVFGNNISLNDPRQPNSWLNEFFTEPSDIFIDPTTLDTTAREQKRQARIAYLERLKGDPLVNPVWLTQELVKACADLQDPKEAMHPALQQAGDQGDTTNIVQSLLMQSAGQTAGMPQA